MVLLFCNATCKGQIFLASVTISALYRYPVKGFSGERIAGAHLTAGEPLPFDRVFAIENGPSGFDPAAPSYLPKIRFLMLMHNERIAQLESRFDPASRILTICKAGRERVSGMLSEANGRLQIED